MNQYIKRVLWLAAMVAATLSFTPTASAQPQTGVATVARTPGCQATFDAALASMTTGTGAQRVTTYRDLTDEEYLSLQRRCSRGQLHVPRAYLAWARGVHGDDNDANVDTGGLDQLNMLRSHGSGHASVSTCDEVWNAHTNDAGVCVCRDHEIPVVVHGHMGCALTQAEVDVVINAFVDQILRPLLLPNNGENIRDAAARVGRQIHDDHASLASINERLRELFETTLPALTGRVQDLETWRHDVVDPTLQHIWGNPPVSQQQVRPLAERASVRPWRVGIGVTALVGHSTPYWIMGPSIGVVVPFGNGSTGFVFLGHATLGVATAENVGTNFGASGAAGLGYAWDRVTLGGMLLGGAAWVPSYDPAFDGPNFAWYMGLGVEAQFRVTHRFHIDLGLGGATGETNQVDDQGHGHRDHGGLFVGRLAATWAF